MTAMEPHLAELSDDQRQLLESWLIEFDQSWDEHRLALWVRKLPARGDRLRRPALLEMVKIDLEHRWQRGRGARLEAYVKALPELGTPDSLPADLILAEYEARQHCGAPANLAEFAQRFPRQADALRRLSEEANGESGASSSRAGRSPVSASAPQALHRGLSIPPDYPTPRPSGPTADASPLPESFGRYRILRKLGQGAMGAVYLAHDAHLDRPVALKVPQFTPDDDPELRQRFLSEARAAATIEHPNICPVYDVGEINGIPYLTMAYLEGQSLAQLLEGPMPLPPRQVAALVRKLALALQEAHDCGIIHRDLKPSNVMMNRRGEPIILDFGLARRVRPGDVRLTRTGQPVGTPAYMSPEQVAGAVEVMGPGCDIFSLGVILYQLLTGRLPFEGSIAEVLGQIVSRRPEPPTRHRPDLDPGLERVCLKALSKEVADRYACMRDFAAALADFLPEGDQRAGVRIAGSAAAPIPWFRRKPFRLVLASAGALTGLLLAGVVLWISTSRGTVRIELNDPRTPVEVQVDGERVESGGLNEPLRLRAGKHHLLITGNTIETVSESFIVARGDNPVLRVRLSPRSDQAADPVPAPSATDPAPGARAHRPRHDDDDEDETSHGRDHRPNKSPSRHDDDEDDR
jgi:hypothetical protein